MTPPPLSRRNLPPPPPPPNLRHGNKPALPSGLRARLGAHSMHGRPISRVVKKTIDGPLGGL